MSQPDPKPAQQSADKPQPKTVAEAVKATLDSIYQPFRQEAKS